MSRTRRAWTPAPPPRGERFAVAATDDAERLRWARSALVAGHRTVDAVAGYVAGAAACGCTTAQAEAALESLRRSGAAVRGPGGWGLR